MRVIAGTLRGRRLETPPGLTTRPITDRVREALFNILGHRFALPGRLPGFEVLDLFAGTGSLGIEALSRGAGSCIFVEHDRGALRSLRQNVRNLHLEAACSVLADNAWRMRPPLPRDGFGLVFIDPPYRDSADPLRVVDLLERLAPSLTPDGLIVYRHPATGGEPLVNRLRLLRCVDQRRYRYMEILLLGRAAPDPVG